MFNRVDIVKPNDRQQRGLMSLENFSVPKNPESRTPSVVLILVALGAMLAGARGVWRLLTGAPFGAEMVIIAVAVGALYAVSRFQRGL